MSEQEVSISMEQCIIIKFLTAEGVQPSEILQRLEKQFGEACFSRTRVFEWWKPFREGRKRSTISVGKVIATFFWDWKGVIHLDFLQEYRTINAENYDSWWYRTPSFFMTMQGVTPLLLSRTSCAAGNGRFWNIHRTHPIWIHVITISSPKWKKKKKKTLRGTRYNTRDELVLATERVSGLILTGPPAELQFIQHCGCAELISESVSSTMLWTYFVYSENVLIPKINSKKRNQIF